MDQVKTITLDDLKAYVDKLAPYDEVGVSADPYKCWIANTAKRKYPDFKPQVYGDNTGVYLTQGSGYITVELSRDVAEAATAFDVWGNTHDDRLGPTKLELIELLPELFGQEGEEVNA